VLYSINWSLNYPSPQHADLLWGKDDTSTVDLATLTPEQGVRFAATNPTNPVYLEAAMVGDVNGDGYRDLAFGDFAWAAGNDNQRGKVRVVVGRASWPATINLDTLSSDLNGFEIVGKNFSETGWAVAAAGDVNGDGVRHRGVGGDRRLREPLHPAHERSVCRIRK
jgi:hypothetical protein